jgi:membrane protein implicated in regulation of membrane protease activity
MADTTVWWVLVAVAVSAELLTGTFHLLMVALGLAAGAMAAHLGLPLEGQLACAAVVGGGAVVALQKMRPVPPHSLPHQANVDVNLDIGQTVHVGHWHPDHSAQVTYRGAAWTVEWVASGPAEAAPVPGQYRIVSVEGSRLRVVAV